MGTHWETAPRWEVREDLSTSWGGLASLMLMLPYALDAPALTYLAPWTTPAGEGRAGQGREGAVRSQKLRLARVWGAGRSAPPG